MTTTVIRAVTCDECEGSGRVYHRGGHDSDTGDSWEGSEGWCGKCHGTGRINCEIYIEDPCGLCHGSGTTSEYTEFRYYPDGTKIPNSGYNPRNVTCPSCHGRGVSESIGRWVS